MTTLSYILLIYLQLYVRIFSTLSNKIIQHTNLKGRIITPNQLEFHDKI